MRNKLTNEQAPKTTHNVVRFVKFPIDGEMDPVKFWSESILEGASINFSAKDSLSRQRTHKAVTTPATHFNINPFESVSVQFDWESNRRQICSLQSASKKKKKKKKKTTKKIGWAVIDDRVKERTHSRLDRHP
jgi:hypothetical protein